MSKHWFKQVDVFTLKPFKGNPLAVIFDADSLSTDEMQQIANWTNLSETTFVQSSKKGDYRLRIFTPMTELPFAGHPTIGSAFALREAGVIPSDRRSFIQDCGAGLIPLTVDDDGIIYAQAPLPKLKDISVHQQEIQELLGGKMIENPMLVDVGPVWGVVHIPNISHLYRLSVDFNRLIALNKKTNSIGLNVYAIDADHEVHVRSFAPADEVPEDPVCGSGNAAVGAHIHSTGLEEKTGSFYIAHQGKAVGRAGMVYVRLDGETVFIGGRAVTVVDGQFTI